MKKWHKITGIIAFTIIGILQLLTWANAYVDMKYLVEPFGIGELIDHGYMYIGGLSFYMWLNYCLALALFVCLWRKRDKK